MKTILAEILIDPVSGKPLLYDEAKNILHTLDYTAIYTITEGVPVILPDPNTSDKSPLHQKPNTGFNYTEHYRKDAEAYDYFVGEENMATKNEIRRLHQAIINTVPKHARLILDAGCGNGWLANYFLKRNRLVISTDISTVNPVKTLQQNPGKNHTALVADVYHLPVKNNSVDCIVASEIMEHVYDPRLFAGKLIEKLKPGGKLIITTPYNEKIEYYLCIHCNQLTPKNAHLHSFNRQNIKPIFTNRDVEWKAKSFANKYLIKSRLNVLLSFLPFGMWKFVDMAANTVLRSPTRFIIEIIKQ